MESNAERLFAQPYHGKVILVDPVILTDMVTRKTTGVEFSDTKATQTMELQSSVSPLISLDLSHATVSVMKDVLHS